MTSQVTKSQGSGGYIFGWGDSIGLLEAFCEIGGRGKTGLIGDLTDRIAFFPQHVGGSFQPVIAQEVGGGNT